jgi:hypothetical protein
VTRPAVRNGDLSPVRPHRENGSETGRGGTFHGAHTPYDYNEVFIR